MRVLPAVLPPLNCTFKSDLVLLPEDFAQAYTYEQQKQAQNLADAANRADIGLLTIGLINKSNILRKHANNSKSLLMAKIAVDLENRIKFHPDINEIAKEYNAGVKAALKLWSEGGISETYYDKSGRAYNSIYTDTNNVTHSLEIENTDGDVKERAEVNLNYQNGTAEYRFVNYKLDDNHKNATIYTNLKTNRVISVSVANNWANTPVSGKPYMASYHTLEGKALAFFDKNARVQKIFYQEYDNVLGAMELGKPVIFIKDANSEFLPLNRV